MIGVGGTGANIDELMRLLESEEITGVLDQLRASRTIPFLPIHDDIVIRHRSRSDYDSDQLVFAFRIIGAIDPLRVLESHRQLARRHDALRLVAAQDLDGFVLSETREWRVKRGSISDIEPSTIEHILRTRRNSRLTLAPGEPLVQSELLSVDSDHHVLVWSFSHAVVDGWSLGVLWDDFIAAYRGELDQSLAGSYAAFLERQQIRKSSTVVRHDALDEDNAAAPGRHEFRLNSHLRKRVESVCQRDDTTLYVLLLGCFLRAAMVNPTVTSDLPVWTPHAGRDTLEDSSSVGMYVRVVNVGTVASLAQPSVSSRDHTQGVLARFVDAAHDVWTDLPDNGVLFVVQNTPGGGAEFPDYAVELMRDRAQPEMAPVLDFYSRSGSPLLISLTIGYRREELVGLLEFDTTRISATAADEIVEAMLAEVVALR